MKILQLVTTSLTLLTISACTDRPTVLDPDPPTSIRTQPTLATSAARQVQASGDFLAQVDFSTITFTPRGQNCLLQVSGQLVFSGTLVGTAIGRTTALVFAPCEAVQDVTNPPGTFPDVFHSELVFTGTVDGEPVRDIPVRYMGRSAPGGHIDGRLIFSRGVQGRLAVDAELAVGGDYEGAVVVN